MSLGLISCLTVRYTPALLLSILVHSLAVGMVLLRFGIKAPDPLPHLASTYLLYRRGMKPT
jgi:hypothetical protein